MTDRYSEGYARAEKVYRQRFNMRNGLLTDTAKQWESATHNRAKNAIRKTWPDLAKQLDLIVTEADKMRGEPR